MSSSDNHLIENSRSLNLPAFLRVLTEKFKHVTFSTSLGMEDQVITHCIYTHNLPIRVFTLDTWRMFDETYKVLEATEARYGKTIEIYYPNKDAVEKLENEKGKFSFYDSVENRKECCYIRKVEPLTRALQGADIWITGLRAGQSPNRKKLDISEYDQTNKVIKVHPIIDWTWEDLKTEIAKHDIPYNSLHDKGFVSIGCAPCTRAIKPNEDFRAGRWWWELSGKKECGLHH